MKSIIILSLLLASNAAFAQQTQTMEKALGAKLMREINESISCNASLISLQDDLMKAQTKIKELEAKAEPKKEPTND